MNKSSKSARRVALDALTAWQSGGFWSARKLSGAIVRAGLDKRDAAFATYLCGGVISNLLLLDYHIEKHSSVRLKKLETRVLCILRLGAFQLLLSDSIPASAAVNETVSLCGGRDRRTRGFVNAVLRRIAEIEDPYAIDKSDPVKYLSVRYSHPEWICRELLSVLDREKAEEVLGANNTAPPVTVLVNTLRADADELRMLLEAEGVRATPHAFVPNCLDLTGSGDIERLETYKKGLFWVQDAASALAVMALDPQPGEKIYDACAAPGGKSFAAAVLARGRASITSRDIHEGRVGMIRSGARRLGLDLEAETGDARVFGSEHEGAYDKVICDVPCSGLGIIRKKPDIRFADEKKFTGLPRLQLEILQNCSGYLRPGGRLLYSTCTWRREENARVVEKFLKANPDFSPEPFELPGPIGRISSGMLTLWPRNLHFDGFFICLMRKNNV
jgi:16S rRNA (cytosine967-C5)-methyltransferase